MASRGARGRPIVNLLPLEPEERVNAVLTVREFSEDRFVFFATRNGIVKKTSLADFSRPRTNGIIAIDLRTDDQLENVALTDGQRDIMLFSSGGRGGPVLVLKVGSLGENPPGGRGIKLSSPYRPISLIAFV